MAACLALVGCLPLTLGAMLEESATRVEKPPACTCFSRVPSKWWGRYARGIGVANSNNAFHSFRHSFVDALREADTGEAVARMLMGHSDGSVHGNYGQGVSLQKLKQSIDRVTFPEVERCFLDLPQATD